MVLSVLWRHGMPADDDDTPWWMNSLPGDRGAACDGSAAGRCLDDIAAYLASVDIDVPMDGDQFATTHTIGFDIDLDILREAAEESGGRYFLADDVETLALALLNIISDITSRSLSFTAPSVAD